MISDLNEQLQQQFEYNLLKAWLSHLEISKMQSDTLEERYAIKLWFKLGKNATETYGMLQTAFRPSSLNRPSVFVWHKRFKEGRESVRDDVRCGRSKEINTIELIRQRVRVTMLRFLREFRKIFRWKGPALFKSGQWHFLQDNTPVHNFILVIDYLTKMGIKTVLQPLYTPDLGPCDFWLFPKLRGCRHETIEEMKEVVTKVIDTLLREDFHRTFQKMLERFKCIAAGGVYFEGNWSLLVNSSNAPRFITLEEITSKWRSFMCVLSIKVPIRTSL